MGLGWHAKQRRIDPDDSVPSQKISTGTQSKHLSKDTAKLGISLDVSLENTPSV